MSVFKSDVNTATLKVQYFRPKNFNIFINEPLAQCAVLL